MTYRVITAPEADRHLAEIDRWWRQNRLAAPDLFLKEFAGASELIAVAPHAGRLYRDAHFPNVRRLLMRATRYHVRVERGQGNRARSPALTRFRPRVCGRGAYDAVM